MYPALPLGKKVGVREPCIFKVTTSALLSHHRTAREGHWQVVPKDSGRCPSRLYHSPPERW